MTTSTPRLTLLSYGAGQDSAAILSLLLTDRAYRERWAPHDLVIAFADTGNEHPETYEHLALARDAAARADLPFEILSLDRGYHRGKWALGLEGFYRATQTVGSKAFRKSCTDNLKIAPLYRWLEEHVAATYALPRGGRKRVLKAFAQRYGKIRVLIGFARGEEHRCAAPPQLSLLPLPSIERPWMRETIDRVYPLIAEGLDRADAQAVIRRANIFPVPRPSNCQFCPYKDEREVWLTALQYPDVFARWVALEQAKLAAWEGRTARNLGVWGREGVGLLDIVAAARQHHPASSLDDLIAHQMSHGHHVASKH